MPEQVYAAMVFVSMATCLFCSIGLSPGKRVMNEWSSLILMAIAGALLATVYLAGLWLTLRSIHTHHHPALWLLGSIILRMGLVIVAFYFILGDQRWQHLLAALAGFIILRAVTISWVRRHMPEPAAEKEKAT
jgi:F1F0 ATPase subunit 2